MRLVVLLALLMTAAVAFARQNEESQVLVADQVAPSHHRLVKRKLSIVVKTFDAINSFARSKPVRMIHNAYSSNKARFSKSPPSKLHPRRPAIAAKPKPVPGGRGQGHHSVPRTNSGVMIDGQMVGGYLSSGPCCRR
ncbi:hypothetical protein Ae201684P_003072 [Aphanomyces euteiches]|nr:hypothetical protein Ae201684P_003072 [Aphanomyces euteiches]KAH9142842.1 hypothetical protein AeRB84_013114 [Aphanomyces euteiches]